MGLDGFLATYVWRCHHCILTVLRWNTLYFLPQINGASFSGAVAAKEATWPELVSRNHYGDLTVLACETAGRRHHAAFTMVSKTTAALLRQEAALAYHRRLWGILSISLQRSGYEPS